MICGHCRGRHDTVAEVRKCAGQPSGSEFIGDAPAPRPTQKQLDFAHGLLRQREPYGAVRDAEMTNSIEAAHEYVSGMDKAQIGEFISTMKDRPLRLTTSVRTSATQVGEGMYRMNGTIYKVQRAYHGSMHLYAKVLIVQDIYGGGSEGRFERSPGALALLRPEHALSLEEAQEFGKLYGFCVRCGRILTDEESIADGIGPICKTKWQR